MWCFSWVNTELNWLFRAFAVSRSFIIGWLPCHVCRNETVSRVVLYMCVGMPMFSRLFALISSSLGARSPGLRSRQIVLVLSVGDAHG